MNSVLRSSEFWVAAIAAVGVGGAQAGLWSSADFDKLLAPALVYVASRMVSKLAKSVSFNGSVKKP